VASLWMLSEAVFRESSHTLLNLFREQFSFATVKTTDVCAGERLS